MWKAYPGVSRISQSRFYSFSHLRHSSWTAQLVVVSQIVLEFCYIHVFVRSMNLDLYQWYESPTIRKRNIGRAHLKKKTVWRSYKPSFPRVCFFWKRPDQPEKTMKIIQALGLISFDLWRSKGEGEGDLATGLATEPILPVSCLGCWGNRGDSVECKRWPTFSGWSKDLQNCINVGYTMIAIVVSYYVALEWRGLLATPWTFLRGGVFHDVPRLQSHQRSCSWENWGWHGLARIGKWVKLRCPCKRIRPLSFRICLFCRYKQLCVEGNLHKSRTRCA